MSDPFLGGGFQYTKQIHRGLLEQRSIQASRSSCVHRARGCQPGVRPRKFSRHGLWQNGLYLGLWLVISLCYYSLEYWIYAYIYMSLYVFKMVVGVVGGINGHNYPNNPNMLGYNLHMVCRLAYPESSSKKLVCIFVSPLSWDLDRDSWSQQNYPLVN